MDSELHQIVYNRAMKYFYLVEYSELGDSSLMYDYGVYKSGYFS